VGGSGGTGGSGDVVTVTNSGQISTQGESSQGILAQSGAAAAVTAASAFRPAAPFFLLRQVWAAQAA